MQFDCGSVLVGDLGIADRDEWCESFSVDRIWQEKSFFPSTSDDILFATVEGGNNEADYSIVKRVRGIGIFGCFPSWDGDALL